MDGGRSNKGYTDTKESSSVSTVLLGTCSAKGIKKIWLFFKNGHGVIFYPGLKYMVLLG